MDDVLSRNWWAILVRGLLALAFGFFTWARPGSTLTILVVLFGVYALNDGIFALVAAAVAGRRQERWWPMAFEGLFGIAVGIFTFLLPLMALTVVFLLIALWALGSGLLELVGAVRLRREIKGEWLMALSGVLRLVFGVLLITRPTAGLHALVWLTGAYALAYGIVLIGLSIRLKRHTAETTGGMTPQPV